MWSEANWTISTFNFPALFICQPVSGSTDWTLFPQTNIFKEHKRSLLLQQCVVVVFLPAQRPPPTVLVCCWPALVTQLPFCTEHTTPITLTHLGLAGRVCLSAPLAVRAPRSLWLPPEYNTDKDPATGPRSDTPRPHTAQNCAVIGYREARFDVVHGLGVGLEMVTFRYLVRDGQA